jgi:hypothetical protein
VAHKSSGSDGRAQESGQQEEKGREQEEKEVEDVE